MALLGNQDEYEAARSSFFMEAGWLTKHILSIIYNDGACLRVGRRTDALIGR